MKAGTLAATSMVDDQVEGDQTRTSLQISKEVHDTFEKGNEKVTGVGADLGDERGSELDAKVCDRGGRLEGKTSKRVDETADTVEEGSVTGEEELGGEIF
ncbi:hypothetical protein vseg_015464 [Gypsophila vaccaria]